MTTGKMTDRMKLQAESTGVYSLRKLRYIVERT